MQVIGYIIVGVVITIAILSIVANLKYKGL